MSQDGAQEEDVKPKLNLNLVFEEQTITVKVKSNMKFAKIFEVTEKKFGKDSGTLKFTYDGQRISGTDTPASLNMDDGDQVDAFLAQVGGGRS